MKDVTKHALVLIVGLAAFLILASSCDDPRTQPIAPEAPTYIETQMLLHKAISGGSSLTVDFQVRDQISGGKLILFCYFKPDADLNSYDALDVENVSLLAEIDSINSLIYQRWLAGDLPLADSLALEEQKQDRYVMINHNDIVRDSLDSRLDNRFNYSVMLEDDTDMLYPNSVYLNATALPYLGNEEIVWGQNNFAALADTGGWRGRRIELDLEEFWVADPTWFNPEKPSRDEFLVVPTRYPDRYTQYELLPVRDWRNRLTPGVNHTLHLRFGATGTQTMISASLYLIYQTAD